MGLIVARREFDVLKKKNLPEKRSKGKYPEEQYSSLKIFLYTSGLIENKHFKFY